MTEDYEEWEKRYDTSWTRKIYILMGNQSCAIGMVQDTQQMGCDSLRSPYRKLYETCSIPNTRPTFLTATPVDWPSEI